MTYIAMRMTRAVRFQLERVVRKSREKHYARRALAVLHFAGQCRRGRSSSESGTLLGVSMAVVVRDV